MELLTTYLIVVAGLFGLIIGSFLNVVVYRVPAGISLMRESRCPACDKPVKPWQNVPVVSWIALGGRCGSCGDPISRRYPLVEALTGASFAGVTWWMLSSGALASETWWSAVPILLALLYFVSISIALTLIDLDTHRLPNAIVLPSYIVAAVLLGLASFIAEDWASLLRAVTGMVALYALYFVLRLARPGGMGGGDVKLAGLIGLYLGYAGWGALVVGAFAAFVLGGIFGVALIILRRAGRKSAIPFGPWMIFGAWVGLVFGDPIGRWYAEVLGA